MTKRSPFKYFKTSPEIIRLAVMMYIWFPLSLRNVEDRTQAPVRVSVVGTRRVTEVAPTTSKCRG